MLLFTSLTTTLLALLTTSAQAQVQDDTCGVTQPLLTFTAFSPAGIRQPWTGMTVNANANRFWLGRPTRARGGELTVFNPINGRTALSLNNVAAPGAQRAYVAGFGAFGFASPNNKGPVDAYFYGFSIATNARGIDVLRLEDPENEGEFLDSFACPADAGETYILYWDRVPLPPGCDRAELRAEPIYYATKYF